MDIFIKLVDFKGKDTRKEYWTLMLIYFTIAFFIGLIGTIAGVGELTLRIFATLLLIIPSFATRVRRLHDIQASGWWSLIALIPVIGFFFSIIIGCIETKENDE